MQVIFVENQDSFSWNVLDVLPVPRSQVALCRPTQALAALARADVLVIGPGPTDPIRAGLIELVQRAVSQRLPTLGICLGHQALGLAFGATLSRGTPAHGLADQVTFSPSRLFPSFVGEQQVMRYHSLHLSHLPAPLRGIATLNDGMCMAIEHTHLPLAGLQFHPDSYATPNGAAIVEDFFRSVWC